MNAIIDHKKDRLADIEVIRENRRASEPVTREEMNRAIDAAVSRLRHELKYSQPEYHSA